jgi:GNAT superfamily N-acetyltransferase
MASSDSPPYAIAPLTAAEIDQAMLLVAEAGWNQLAPDWQLFLSQGTVHAVRTPDGRVVATGATLPYGGRFAWISMVLVNGPHRRRGLATHLLNLCIDEIKRAGMVPVLDATPAGRAVYRKLGFLDAWGISLLERAQQRPATAPPPPDVTVRPATQGDLGKIGTYDAAAFGADRGEVLKRLQARLPAGAWVALRQDRVVGHLHGRDGRRATQLGPLVADDSAIAMALVARALAQFTGPVYVDVADAKTEVRAWLEAAGFKVQRPWTRMLLGRATSFDDTARVFAIGGPEIG